jgi:hypothetical protein
MLLANLMGFATELCPKEAIIFYPRFCPTSCGNMFSAIWRSTSILQQVFHSKSL